MSPMPQEYRPYWTDKREEQRLALCLDGVIRVDDEAEIAVQSRDVSIHGMAIATGTCPPIGARIVGDFEEIGSVRGQVLRRQDDGFAVVFSHDEARMIELGRLLDALEWSRGRYALGMRPSPPQPGSASLARASRRPAPDIHLELHLPDHRIIVEKLRDVSQSGASVISLERPAIGAHINIEGLLALVVRHTSDGFAVRFV
jgi:hypothetical protein